MEQRSESSSGIGLIQGIMGKKVWTWPSQAPWQRGVETQANGKFRSLPYLGTTWPSAAGNPLTLAPAVAATTDCDEAERPVRLRRPVAGGT